jgi:hypothetical protein
MVTVKLERLRDYDRVAEELVRRGFTSIGLISHCAAATDGGVLVVDIWPSEQAWKDYVKRGLEPAFQAVGLRDQPEVHLYPVHNLGWPGKFAQAGEEARPH